MTSPTGNRDLPRSFVARLAQLASMPETDMVMILNRMAADGYVTRVRKNDAYLFANLPTPAADKPGTPGTAIGTAIANAQDRIRQRRATPPPLTMTAAAIPDAARRITGGRHRRPSGTGGAPPVKQVLEQMRRQIEQPPEDRP